MRRLSADKVFKGSVVGAVLLGLLALALLWRFGWLPALVAFAVAAWFAVDAWRAARWIREERQRNDPSP